MMRYLWSIPQVSLAWPRLTERSRIDFVLLDWLTEQSYKWPIIGLLAEPQTRRVRGPINRDHGCFGHLVVGLPTSQVEHADCNRPTHRWCPEKDPQATGTGRLPVAATTGGFGRTDSWIEVENEKKPRSAITSPHALAFHELTLHSTFYSIQSISRTIAKYIIRKYASTTKSISAICCIIIIINIVQRSATGWAPLTVAFFAELLVAIERTDTKGGYGVDLLRGEK